MRAMSLSQQLNKDSSSPPGKSLNLEREKVLSEDEVLVKNAQENIQEFEKLYDLNYEKIFRYVYQRTATKQDAKDVTSQVFLKAMIKINQFKFMGFPFSSWLYRIAKSETYQFLKDKSKTSTLNIETSQLENLSEEISENETVLSSENLIPILEKLKDSEIQLIEMRFFEQRSFKEIGEILNISENNAKVKTHRIIKSIRQK